MFKEIKPLVRAGFREEKVIVSECLKLRSLKTNCDQLLTLTVLTFDLIFFFFFFFAFGALINTRVKKEKIKESTMIRRHFTVVKQ